MENRGRRRACFDAWPWRGFTPGAGLQRYKFWLEVRLVQATGALQMRVNSQTIVKLNRAAPESWPRDRDGDTAVLGFCHLQLPRRRSTRPIGRHTPGLFWQ